MNKTRRYFVSGRATHDGIVGDFNAEIVTNGNFVVHRAQESIAAQTGCTKPVITNFFPLDDWELLVEEPQTSPSSPPPAAMAPNDFGIAVSEPEDEDDDCDDCCCHCDCEE